MSSLAATLVVVLFVFAFSERVVYAYLDPGSGSMMLQLLLGGVAGIAVIVKLSWQRIRAVFGRKDDETRAPHV